MPPHHQLVTVATPQTVKQELEEVQDALVDADLMAAATDAQRQAYDAFSALHRAQLRARKLGDIDNHGDGDATNVSGVLRAWKGVGECRHVCADRRMSCAWHSLQWMTHVSWQRHTKLVQASSHACLRSSGGAGTPCSGCTPARVSKHWWERSSCVAAHCLQCLARSAWRCALHGMPR